MAVPEYVEAECVGGPLDGTVYLVRAGPDETTPLPWEIGRPLRDFPNLQTATYILVQRARDGKWLLWFQQVE